MKKKPKIIFATGIFPPDIGGPATYVEKMAKELTDRGFEVSVITYSNKKFKIQNYEFPVTQVSRRLWPGLRHFVYFLKLLLLAKGCDVIYAQNSVSAGVPACLTAKIMCKKFVLKIVGDWAWEKAREKGIGPENVLDFYRRKYGLKWEVCKKIEKGVAGRAELVILPSHYLKSIVRAWGISENKLKVIYNAIDNAPTAASSREEAQKKVGIFGSIILSIGRLLPIKGFEALIEIMAGLLKQEPNLKLVIVGDGAGMENLKFKIKNLKLENKVILIGRVPHNEIPVYLKAADMFVLNSQYEGLSHVLLEAMQAGLPIIASNKGGNPEVIDHNVDGLLIEYNNQEQLKQAILTLHRQPELKSKFIQNSQTKLQQFSYAQMVDNTLSILTGL